MATIPHPLPADDTLTAGEPRDLGRRLLRGGVWVVAGRGIGVLFALLAEQIVAHRLGRQYGMFRFLFTSIAFLGIFSRLGTETPFSGSLANPSGSEIIGELDRH